VFDSHIPAYSTLEARVQAEKLQNSNPSVSVSRAGWRVGTRLPKPRQLREQIV